MSLTPGLMIVSIRSRLFSREIHDGFVSSARSCMFQSAPGFLAGRYVRSGLLPTIDRSFNPLPAF